MYQGVHYPSYASAAHEMGITTNQVYHFIKSGFTSGDEILDHIAKKTAKAAKWRAKIAKKPYTPKIKDPPHTKESWAAFLEFTNARLKEIQEKRTPVCRL